MNPAIEIVSQPCKQYRMRYESEKRKENLLTADGFQSSNIKKKKKFPIVKLINFNKFYSSGYLQIVCVCKAPSNDFKYKVHPNKLFGKNCTEYGVARIDIKSFKNEETIELEGIGIQQVKAEKIVERISAYKENNIDPFDAGFDSIDKKIDLKCLKLCFQIFLKDNAGNIIKSDPIVSQAIHSLTKLDLIVERIINARGSVHGGDEVVIILKKKVPPEAHILVKFFQNENFDNEVFPIDGIYHGYTVVFKSPQYLGYLQRSLIVNFQLCMTTGDVYLESNVFEFTYEPPSEIDSIIIEPRNDLFLQNNIQVDTDVLNEMLNES